MINKTRLTEAVQAFKGGDNEKFDVVYEETYNNLYVYCLLIHI